MSRLYSTTEAAERTGKATSTITYLARERGIGRKVGPNWIFTDEDLERLASVPIGRPRRPRGKRDAS